MLQKQVSDQITAVLNAFQDARDKMAEQLFFAIYGSPLLQGLLGINNGEKVRKLPGTTPEKVAEKKARMEAYAAKLLKGGIDEALARAVLYVIAADRALDDRCGRALGTTYRQETQLSIEQFKTLIRDQFFVLLLEGERAVDALAELVPDADKRTVLLERINTIITAGDAPTPGERERLARLQKLLEVRSVPAPVMSPAPKTNTRQPRQVARQETQEITPSRHS
jgi:hypothetical protein